MANEKLNAIGKNGLPFVIASVLCGYATNYIPDYFPIGESRDWAYRSIPALSLVIVFLLRVLKDLGSMTFSELFFTKVCAGPEKKRLLKIINDAHASPENKKQAKERYNHILDGEMQIGGQTVNYFYGFFSKPSIPPALPSPSDEK